MNVPEMGCYTVGAQSKINETVSLVMTGSH